MAIAQALTATATRRGMVLQGEVGQGDGRLRAGSHLLGEAVLLLEHTQTLIHASPHVVALRLRMHWPRPEHALALGRLLVEPPKTLLER